jgi:hypothetical protein
VVALGACLAVSACGGDSETTSSQTITVTAPTSTSTNSSTTSTTSTTSTSTSTPSPTTTTEDNGDDSGGVSPGDQSGQDSLDDFCNANPGACE